jgi:hypothetical protein
VQVERCENGGSFRALSGRHAVFHDQPETRTMRTPRSLAVAVIAATLLLPTVSNAQSSPAIITDDYLGGSSSSHSLTATVPLRRGISTSVKIVKDFIDLVPFELVSISGGGTISSLSNGRTSQGKGFIAMSVTVPSGQTPGSTITLKVGLNDEFKFKAVHRGEISNITRTPNPSTIAPGTSWNAVVSGVDLGSVALNSLLQCHSVTESNRSNSSVTFRLTKTDGCSTTTNFTAGFRGTASDDPPSYVTPQGGAISIAFSYAPPPPTGLACTSDPALGLPNIIAPANGAQLSFLPATTSPVNVTIRWDSLTASNRPAPLNEWIVTARTVSALGAILVSSGGKQATTITVRGLQTTLRLALPDTHTVTIRPKNCGQEAPSRSVTFGVIRQ